MAQRIRPVACVGRYALYEALASGGMGSVHLGKQLGPGGFARTVAIKRPHAPHLGDPRLRQMFADEIRLVARIAHPNVVASIDVVAEDRDLFLVMEYVHGETLAKLLSTAAAGGARVALDIVTAITIDVLEGLHAAHCATDTRQEPLGLVHRDVSPQNVLVGVDGRARVLDFGVAKAAGREQRTATGEVKGKLAYMAPEQLRGETIDRRVDVYAVGVVLWEALTGRRLFPATDPAALVDQVLLGLPRSPSRFAPGLPADLEDIVMKALAPSPDDRFESAHAMAEALQSCTRPAAASAVGSWVEALAAEELERRALLVAAVEADDSVVGSPSWGRIRVAEGAAHAEDDRPAVRVVPLRRAPRPKVVLAAAAASAILLVALVLAVLRVRTNDGGLDARPTSAGAAPSAPAGAAPAPAPLASAEPQAAPEPPVLSSAPARKAVGGARRAPKRAGDCDVPFSVDAEGRKVYKRSCL